MLGLMVRGLKPQPTKRTHVSYQTVVQPRLVEPALVVFSRRRGVWPPVSVTSTNRSGVTHTGTRQSHPCSRKSSRACYPLSVLERGISARLVTVHRDERKSFRILGEGIVRKRSSFGKIQCRVGVERCGGRSKRLDHEGNEKQSSHLQMQVGSAL